MAASVELEYEVIGIGALGEGPDSKYAQFVLAVFECKDPDDDPQHPRPPSSRRLNIAIPKEKWKGQYSMYQRYRLTVNDDGTAVLRYASAIHEE